MNTDQPRYAVRRVDHPALGPQWTIVVPNARLDPVSPRYQPDEPPLVPGARTYTFGRGPAAFEEARDALFGPLAVDEATRDGRPDPTGHLDGEKLWKPFGADTSKRMSTTFTITDPDAVRRLAAMFDEPEDQPAPTTWEEFVLAVTAGVERALKHRDDQIRDRGHARVDAYVIAQLARPGGMEELNEQGIYPVTGPEPAHMTHDADWRPVPHVIHDRDCDEWRWNSTTEEWVQSWNGTRSKWGGDPMVERGPFHAHRTA